MDDQEVHSHELSSQRRWFKRAKKKAAAGKAAAKAPDDELPNLGPEYVRPLPKGLGVKRSGFGMRTLFGVTGMHTGDDYAAPSGTPVFASATGTVELKPKNGAYGNFIELEAEKGNYDFRYGHLSGFAKDLKPDRNGEIHVKMGQVIGYVGSTGRSTGPHLHYEVKNKQTAGLLDPLKTVVRKSLALTTGAARDLANGAVQSVTEAGELVELAGKDALRYLAQLANAIPKPPGPLKPVDIAHADLVDPETQRLSAKAAEDTPSPVGQVKLSAQFMPLGKKRPATIEGALADRAQQDKHFAVRQLALARVAERKAAREARLAAPAEQRQTVAAARIEKPAATAARSLAPVAETPEPVPHREASIPARTPITDESAAAKAVPAATRETSTSYARLHEKLAVPVLRGLSAIDIARIQQGLLGSRKHQRYLRNTAKVAKAEEWMRDTIGADAAELKGNALAKRLKNRIVDVQTELNFDGKTRQSRKDGIYGDFTDTKLREKQIALGKAVAQNASLPAGL